MCPHKLPLHRETCSPVNINNVDIPQTNMVKYLELHLDSKLNWKQHVINKKKQIKIKTKELYQMIGRKSKLTIDNKLLIYKTVARPIWTYGIELWGCTSKSNRAIIQRWQLKILR